MLLRKVILMLALGLTCSSAMAEWTKVLVDNEFEVYMDLSTKHKVKNKVKMWDMYNFNTTQELDGARFLSMAGQTEYDCKEDTSRGFTSNRYAGSMASGAVVYSQTNANQEPIPISPNSIGAAMLKFACGKH